MTQFSIVAFHRKGLAFVIHGKVVGGPLARHVAGPKGITEIDAGLECGAATFIHDPPTQDAPGMLFHICYSTYVIPQRSCGGVCFFAPAGGEESIILNRLRLL